MAEGMRERIRAVIDQWNAEDGQTACFGATWDRLAERIDQALTESGALLPEGWLPLTMRELETLREEVRRLPFWQVRTTTGEDLMVLVKEALLANKDFPTIAALLRSEGAKREE